MTLYSGQKSLEFRFTAFITVSILELRWCCACMVDQTSRLVGQNDTLKVEKYAINCK